MRTKEQLEASGEAKAIVAACERDQDNETIFQSLAAQYNTTREVVFAIYMGSLLGF